MPVFFVCKDGRGIIREFLSDVLKVSVLLFRYSCYHKLHMQVPVKYQQQLLCCVSCETGCTCHWLST